MEPVVDNLGFTPRPINAVGIRGAGAGILVPRAIIQRTTALRAYAAFAGGQDWMEKLSSAYVVALATRSADEFLMQTLHGFFAEANSFSCASCRDSSIGVNAIRAGLFPKLRELRTYANKLIHHLDEPKHRGVAELNVQGVFDYCYHLFEDNSDLLFGAIPQGELPNLKCKKCRSGHRQER